MRSNQESLSEPTPVAPYSPEPLAPAITDKLFSDAAKKYEAVVANQNTHEHVAFRNLPARHKALFNLIEINEDRSGYPKPTDTSAPRVTPIGLELGGVRYPFSEEQARANHKTLIESLADSAPTPDSIMLILDATQEDLRDALMTSLAEKAKQDTILKYQKILKAARREISEKYHQKRSYNAYITERIWTIAPDFLQEDVESVVRKIHQIHLGINPLLSANASVIKEKRCDDIYDDYYREISTVLGARGPASTNKTSDRSLEPYFFPMVAQSHKLKHYGFLSKYVDMLGKTKNTPERVYERFVAECEEHIKSAYPSCDSAKLRKITYETMKKWGEVKSADLDSSEQDLNAMREMVINRRFNNRINALSESLGRKVPRELAELDLYDEYNKNLTKIMAKDHIISDDDAEELNSYPSKRDELLKTAEDVMPAIDTKERDRLYKEYYRVARRYESCFCDKAMSLLPTMNVEHPKQLEAALRTKRYDVLMNWWYPEMASITYDIESCRNDMIEALQKCGMEEKRAAQLVADFTNMAQHYYIDTFPRCTDLSYYFKFSGDIKSSMTIDDQERLEQAKLKIETEFREKTADEVIMEHAKNAYDEMIKKMAEKTYGPDAHKVYYFPTGTVIAYDDGHVSADTSSPLSADIIASVPKLYQKTWSKFWSTARNDATKFSCTATIKAVNDRVEQIHTEYLSDSEKADEKFLSELPFDTPRLLKINGRFNSLPDADNCSALKEIMGHLGDYVADVNYNERDETTAKPKMQKIVKSFMRDSQKTNLDEVITGEKGRYAININMFRNADNETLSMASTFIGAKLYQDYEDQIRQVFMETLGARVNISPTIAYRLTNERVDSLARRRLIATRAYFIAYFNRFISGRGEIPNESKQLLDDFISFVKETRA